MQQEEIINRIINGCYKTKQDEKDACENAGFSFNEIQEQVNKTLLENEFRKAYEAFGKVDKD